MESPGQTKQTGMTGAYRNRLRSPAMATGRAGSPRGDRPSTTVDALQERIPPSMFTFQFARSSGPGGQNVNKVNTRATLLFDLRASAALTAREQRLIESKLASRIGKNGLLRIVSFRHRTQLANKRAVIHRFYELLAEVLTPVKARKPSKPTAGSRRRRLADKRARSDLKRQRSERIGSRNDG